ncbi:MAG: hypothetical protein ACI9SC_000863, partial [Gammaproteobacteria bacterium]
NTKHNTGNRKSGIQDWTCQSRIKGIAGIMVTTVKSGKKSE